MHKILIVDDERHLIQQVRDIGYSSDFVIKAEHIFPKLEKEAFHLILMNVNLPGANGGDLLKEIKTHPVHQAIPVVILMSETDDRRLATCLEYGATDLITKPVHEGVLKSRIQFALTTNTYKRI